MTLNSDFPILNCITVITRTHNSLRIMGFEPRDCHLSPLFKNQNLLKLDDKSKFENVPQVSKDISNISIIYHIINILQLVHTLI